MADIAYDLLFDLLQSDRTPGHPGCAAERRRVTAIMRQNSFTDEEIAVTLGDQVEHTLEAETAINGPIKLPAR